MSISESLYIGASGLISHGNAMSVVGDNIANASTIGFKRERASFEDLLGSEMVNHREGGGSYLGKSQTMWNQGAIQQTGNGMDVAISGDGMFVVNGTHAGVSGQYYSRDGRFSMTNDGYLVDQQGMRIQGYTANTDGSMQTNLGDLHLGGAMSSPVATTKAQLGLNLDSNAPVNTNWDSSNPDATATYSTSIKVTDSLGNTHPIDMCYVKTGDGTWDVHAMDNSTTPPTELGTGQLTFDTNGKLTSSSGSITAQFAGAASQTIALDFSQVTQNAGTAGATTFGTVGTNSIDGHGAGSLESIQIDPDGKIEGSYDNGDKLVIGQVALAKVTNMDGMQRMGDGLYATTNESGQATIDGAGRGGRGALVAGALEQSNVDLSTELVTLIAYQRAFQANAKTVTTSDEMLQDVDNLKR